MMHIIRADLYRFRKSKVMFGISIGFLIILTVGNLTAIRGEGKVMIISDALWLNQANYAVKGSKIILEILKGSNILVFFLIPIVLHVFVSDFTFQTIKNTVSYKYSRIKIYLAKFITCSLLVLLLVTSYIVYALVLKLLFNNMKGAIYVSDIVQAIKIVSLQFPIYVGIIGIILLIGTLFQNGTLVTVITILYLIYNTTLIHMIKWANFAKVEPITCLDKAAYLSSLKTHEIVQIIGIGLLMLICSVSIGAYIFSQKDFK